MDDQYRRAHFHDIKEQHVFSKPLDKIIQIQLACFHLTFAQAKESKSVLDNLLQGSVLQVLFYFHSVPLCQIFILRWPGGKLEDRVWIAFHVAFESRGSHSEDWTSIYAASILDESDCKITSGTYLWTHMYYS